MIQKLRKFLGLETEEEKMQDLLEINKSLSDLHKSIEEVADDFTSKNEGYKELLKSENLTEEFKKSIQQRHKFLIEDQKEEIQSLIKQRNKLREEHKSLMKNEKIFKAVSEISFYDNLKAKYKANELTPKQYDLVLKAKQGRVLYADNIVFNEKGQILLLQRTRVEDDKNGGKWVIPGGHVDAGEEFCEAALRELQEESGITVNDCEEVGIFEDNGVEIHYFESIVKEKDVQIILQDGESESFVWVHLDELDKYDMPFNMAENILNLYPHCKEEVLNISKAVESGRLSESLGNDLIGKIRTESLEIEKAKRTGVYTDTAENRKLKRVGQKYSKEKSGEVSTEKEGKQEEPSNKETKDQPIEEHAKQASETALQNASKSGDEELRIAAKKELERRESEHQPEGDGEKDNKDESKDSESKQVQAENHSGIKKEEGVSENEHIEKFRTLSDEQVKFYLDAPYPKVKEAAQAVAEERGLKIISKEDYIKSFEDLSKATPKKQRDFYVKEGEGASTYLRSNEEINKSVSYYRQNGYIQIRRLLIDENKYKESLEGKVRNVDQSLEISKKGVENISKFISDNKIQKDLSLNRRVLTGDTFFTKLKEGDIYEDKSFSSTSLGELEQFGDFNIKILAKKGSSVANLDNFAEKEYLIDKGSKFRVLETKDNGITVELL